MSGRGVLVLGTVLFMAGVVVSVLWLRSARIPAPESGDAESPAMVRASTADEAVSASADNARRARLAAAFAELQASRQALQRQLGDLKSVLWGRELPVDQARSISKAMMSAQYLLKDPALLGAFSESGAIFAEKDKADAARTQLQEISLTLQQP